MLLNDEGRHIDHLFSSLEDMIHFTGEFHQRCALHESGMCESHQSQKPCAVESSSATSNISMGITGSPCNPYSTQRAGKRFSDGSVASHPLHDTTMEHVVTFYKKFEPNVGITEQVRGFDMRYSSSVETTPLQMLLVLSVAVSSVYFSPVFSGKSYAYSKIYNAKSNEM